jgi:hypothetical protein
MCIYYVNKSGLHYTSREHIFPAALGGIRMLEKGVVSDEANHHFSSMELALMRDSIVSFERGLYGPGKRGTDKLPSNAKICLCTGENGKPELGFLFEGKPCIIWQIVIRNGENKSFDLYGPPNSSDKVDEERIFFCKNMLEIFDKPKHKLVMIDNSLEDETLVGYYNDKVFIAGKFNENMECKLKELLHSIISKKHSSSIMHETQYQPVIKVAMRLDEDNARVFGKIAFNALAYLEGEKFVLQDEFNDFRAWLLGDKETEDILYSKIPGIGNNFRTLPDVCHCCFITSARDVNSNQFVVQALVKLYDVTYSFLLGRFNSNPVGYPIGIICDFKNKMEYTIMEWAKKLHIESD